MRDTFNNPSPFVMVPKDKKRLKSSKVREQYKIMNAILEPYKQQIADEAAQATIDEILYGRVD